MRILTMLAFILVLTGTASADERAIETFADGDARWTGGELTDRYAAEGGHTYLIPPGASATFVPGDGDWSAYRHLKVDVQNPGRVAMMQFRFTDADGRAITAFEYNVYAGRTTQHVRIDGLHNDFGVNAGIDTRRIAQVEIQVRERRRMDPCRDGLYIDRLRLSTERTESYATASLDAYADLPETPPGFVHPEFPGFDAGYNTWAIDPKDYQILSVPGAGPDGGRALSFIPLGVDTIRIWDGRRTYPEAGSYTVRFHARGPEGSVFEDRGNGLSFDLAPEWQAFSYPIEIDEAGQSKRFVLQAANLQGEPVYLDAFVVTKDGAKGSLEPVSQASGRPKVVTYGDGIVYVDGVATFVMGFLRGDPEMLKGSPFNYCGPQELLQESMAYYDACARYGLLTSVNLTASMRSIAPESAAWFAKKYKSHPALFSYYLCDEPDHASPSAVSEPPVLQRATEILHRLDPNHPTHALVIPWCSSNMYRYRDVVDFLSADRYAIKGTPDNDELWTVWRASEAMRRSAADGEVNLFTPLARRGISREESVAQAYMCVVSGAGGIVWWHMGGAKDSWQDFVDVGNELREIERFLVGVELEAGLRFENDVLETFTSAGTAYPGFRQIRGIGRAAISDEGSETALIAVNVTPHEAPGVVLHAPFLAFADEATVMFEDRTVPVADGVIVDDFAGLARHVYVVRGAPEGVKARPVPQPGGPHVFDSGWRYVEKPGDDGAGDAMRRLEMERERYMEIMSKRAEEAIARGDRKAARAIYEEILRRYPDAQDIRERLRSM